MCLFLWFIYVGVSSSQYLVLRHNCICFLIFIGLLPDFLPVAIIPVTDFGFLKHKSDRVLLLLKKSSVASCCLRKLVHPLFCFLPTSCLHLPSSFKGSGVLPRRFYCTSDVFLPQDNGQILYQCTEGPPWAVAFIFCHGSMKMTNSLTSLCFCTYCSFFSRIRFSFLAILLNHFIFLKAQNRSPFPGKLLGIFLSMTPLPIFHCILCSLLPMLYNILQLFHCSICCILLFLLSFVVPFVPAQTYSYSIHFWWMND